MKPPPPPPISTRTEKLPNEGLAPLGFGILMVVGMLVSIFKGGF